MDKRYALGLTGIALIAAVSAFVYFSYHVPVAEVQAPYVVPQLTKSYSNDTYKFSLKMPESFEATEIPDTDNGGYTVLLQDKAGNGIQILITPYGGDVHSLTADDIRAQVPDMQISDVQTLQVGESGAGVAFKSDNEAFGGGSREVWFVFKGNLYQISTYERLDGLLKQIFATWQFQ